MLEAKALKKVYKTKKGVSVEALKGVSIKFPEKGMVFLLGKSGSGKSTLLNLLGGLDKYDDGEIIIKGVSSKEFKQSHFDSYRNTYVGFIFQEYKRGQRYKGDKQRKGFGLGLCYVAAVVKAHHGHIQVNSDGKQGTEFIIEIPQRKAKD